MYNNYRPIMRRFDNNDRLIGGGFVGPFLLGGLTGGLVAPLFYGGYNRPYYGPYYGPYRPYGPFYR